MSRRTFISLLFAPVLLAGFLWLALAWLLGSAGGSSWMLDQIAKALPGEMRIAKREGSFSEGLQLQGVEFSGEGMTVRICRAEFTVEAGLFPPLLRLGPARIADLDIVLPAAVNDGERDLRTSLAGLRLPLALDVRQTVIEGLAVRDSDGAPVASFERLALAGRWHESIEVLQLTLSRKEIEATATGRFGLDATLAHDLTVNGRVRGDLTPAVAEEIGFALSLNGSDARSTMTLETGPFPGLRMQGVIEAPFNRPLMDLSFTIDEWRIPGSPDHDLRVENVQGALRGPPESYELALDGRIFDARLGPVEVELNGRGSLAGLQIENLDLQSESAAITAEGRIAWTGERAAELAIQLERLDPRHWLERWPTGLPVTGAAEAEWGPGSLSVSRLSLRTGETPFRLDASALLDLRTDRLEADLGWTGFVWPPGEAASSWRSPQGTLRVSGKPGEWAAQGEAELATQEFPGGRFSFSGRGGTDQADLLIEHGSALGGELSGLAHLDWDGPLEWRAELDLHGIALGQLLPQWPAVLDARVTAGQDRDTGRLSVDFRDVEGTFRGEAFTGGGGLGFQGGAMRFERVWLRSGRSAVALDGTLVGPTGLAFDVDVRQPGWMADTLGGELAGTGRYAPLARNPLQGTELTGSGLSWGDYGAAQLTLSEQGDADGRIDLVLRGSGIRLGGTLLDQAGLHVRGERDSQALELNLRMGDRELSATMQGALADWQNVLDGGWLGRLLSMGLFERGQPLLRLKNPVPFGVSADRGWFEQSCLQLEPDGEICLAGDFDGVQGVQFAGQFNAVPIGVSRLFLEHDVVFTQRLDGSFNWRRRPGDRPSGRADIHISPGEMGAAGDEDARVQTAAGYIGFDLRDGDLTAGRFELPFPGIGELDLDFQVSNLALDGTGRINGRARVNFSDLSFLDGLIASLDGIHGALSSDLQIGGLTADPDYSGSISLTGAGFRLPYLEAEVSDIDLEGTVNRADRVRFRGGFRAGQGSGVIDLDAVVHDLLDPVLNLSVSGKDLSVANLPDFAMRVDSEMQLARRDGRWEIDGEINVPYAHATPITSFVTKVSESPDLEVARGELPPAPPPAIPADFMLNGELNVHLGDDVRLDTEIARVKMTGDVRLDWHDSALPIGNGAVQLTGEVSAWGPLLHLTNSAIRYPGVPLDAPVLDIRAERTIYGNTLVRDSGVRVTGTPRRPEIEAYTVPPTTPDRAWGVLVTGSDVDIGQGVGALSVGTYIAPRLYLSYGFSLFNDENVVGVRYDLKKGWGVKATSSQRESGLDMSYTIEH